MSNILPQPIQEAYLFVASKEKAVENSIPLAILTTLHMTVAIILLFAPLFTIVALTACYLLYNRDVTSLYEEVLAAIMYAVLSVLSIPAFWSLQFHCKLFYLGIFYEPHTRVHNAKELWRSEVNALLEQHHYPPIGRWDDRVLVRGNEVWLLDDDGQPMSE